MRTTSRVIAWFLIGVTVAILTFATASLLALERSRPEVMDRPEQVSFLYGHALPLTFVVVAALIIRSRPRHPEGWLFALFAILTAASQALQVHTLWHPDNVALSRLHSLASAPVVGLLALMLVLFPDGRPPSPRWRPVVWLVALVTVGVELSEGAGRSIPGAVESTDAARTFVVPLSFVLTGVVALWFRWRHAAGETRQQVKWLTLAASFFGVEFALGFVLALTHSMDDDPGSYYIGNGVFILTICLIPAAMGMAIVRHHLYDVDRLLSRTIAYGLLLVAAAALYVASVAVFASALASRSRSPAVLAVATTAVAVVALQPLRRRWVAWADRRVYGTRTEPAEMMAGVAAELSAYRSPEEGVTGLAEAARRATRARGALVRIVLPDGTDQVAASGDLSAAGARTSVPIRVDAIDVGTITVVDRSRHSEGLALLAKLASLAGPAVTDIRTMAELRQLRARIVAGNADLTASRSRLAQAEEQERAHLRQIVQTDVVPALLGLRQGLPSVAAISTGDVRGDQLDEAARQSRELAERIRGLAHDVLPPVLADRGLAAALRAYVRRRGADLTLAVPESRRLPEAMEAELYLSGRSMVDAMAATAGPASLTLTVSAEDVRLAGTAPTEGPHDRDERREQALRLLVDRVAVLGGGVTTRASEQVTEIRCRVPLPAEP